MYSPASVMTVGSTLWNSKLYKGVVARLDAVLKKEEPLEDLLLRPELVLVSLNPSLLLLPEGPFSSVGELAEDEETGCCCW